MLRIIDVSETPARLSVRLDNLCIGVNQQETRIRLDELAAVVISHPQVSFTHAALSGLADANVAFVACDSRRMPVGMLLPLHPHGTQTQSFAEQAKLSKPTCKQLWKQIIIAKIASQAALLDSLGVMAEDLLDMSRHVRSGDPENLEAQAAKIHFGRLFGYSFRRQFNALDQNRHLNYGYAVLRGIVTRAICGAGLHPSLGIHHHHRNNPFALADDLIEPFRPLVDRAVYLWEKDHDPRDEFDREAKRHLIEALLCRIELESEQRTLFDVVARMACSLAAVARGQRKRMILPKPKAIIAAVREEE